jgi:hypothetical protein
MNPDDLERLVDQDLKRLPAPRAPKTLLPRVLAATVERPAVPWYAQPWLAWPLAWQAASVAALLALGAAMFFALPLVHQVSWDAAARRTVVATGGDAGVLEALAKAATLARVLCRMVIEPVAFAVLVLTVWLSLSCAALWAALDKFALGERS